ncbi:MAG: tRNA pseudouridine(13) synthase TruD, partial [Candidatus Methanomethyliaceae archaeon]
MHYFDMSKLYYFSKKPGIGGKIKATPEDFIVEEITTDGSVLSIDKIFSRKDEEGSFTHFILQKRSWTTEGALRRIGDALGVGKKRFSYAGSKDKNAFTTQLVSAYKVAKEDLLSLKLKDIKILGAWYAKDKVHLGELLGNRFTIRVVDVKEKEPSKKIKKIANEIKMHFPN